MGLRRRGAGEGLNPWPGYVDALSTLLMVIIFVLLVFVLAQAFLSVALSGRDKALDQVTRQMAQLTDMLSLERGRTQELQLSIAQLNQDLKTAVSARDGLTQELSTLRAAVARAEADRDALAGERDRLAARLSDADVQANAAQSRIAQLQAASEAKAKLGDASAEQAATTQAQLIQAQRDLAAMRAQAAELDRTVTADRATIQARLYDLARLTEENRALAALRDDLEKQAQSAAAKTLTEEQARAAVAAQLADEKKLGDSARAQLALLNQQMDQLRAQLAGVSKALEASEASARDKDVQIVNLGSRLNAALAQKVEELQSYRSEFFGRLRQVLAGRSGVQVVGDRFVFQSEVLFPSGSADLSQPGMESLFRLADTLRDIIKDIPKDVPWILRVDGHADRQPVNGGRFASNWELSAIRAINVVKLLSVAGIPSNHLAATAFGDTQPIDPADTPEAFAKNRRIEFRLTDR